MKGEGADAFRVYVKDAKGRKYRFPVLGFSAVERTGMDLCRNCFVKEMKFGYWEQPEEIGDVLVILTWRGLVSNHGQTRTRQNGRKDLKGKIDAVPTPLDNFCKET